jgi:3-oxoacyl-[acyl-carrier-protein] synthase-3
VGSSRRPFVDAAMLAAGEAVPVMDGRQVFRLAVTRMPEATREVLAACGYGPEDLDLLIMHQANLRINEAAQKALGLPDAKVHNNIQTYGNTTSATLPLAFHEARLAGKAPPGSLVAFTALGAGLHWGAVLVRV